MAQNPNRDINESINEDKSNREMLVKADHVKVYFKGKDKKSGTVKAVDDVSFHIMKGETQPVRLPLPEKRKPRG